MIAQYIKLFKFMNFYLLEERRGQTWISQLFRLGIDLREYFQYFVIFRLLRKIMRYLINLMIFQMCLRYAKSLDRRSPIYTIKAFRSLYLRQVLCQATSCRKCEKVMVQFNKRDREQKVSLHFTIQPYNYFSCASLYYQ